jgi:hypothetical protein
VYDSRPDTYEHIRKVGRYIDKVVVNLLDRASKHDASKLISPEVEAFDEMTPRLAGLVYGSEEYKLSLAQLGEALTHHITNNRHHPEYHDEGIAGMTLLDLIEMLVDWKAASERVRPPMPSAPGTKETPKYTGDFMQSITLNQKRFGYGDELLSILENTAKELGFVE